MDAKVCDTHIKLCYHIRVRKSACMHWVYIYIYMYMSCVAVCISVMYSYTSDCAYQLVYVNILAESEYPSMHPIPIVFLLNQLD